METICHQIITNKLEECILSIPSPFDESLTIDLYVNLDKNTKNTVKIVDGIPYITSDVNLKTRILSADKNANYIQEDNLKLIEEYANSYIKSEIENYFYKTSKVFKSDISLLGKHAVKYFKTWKDWVDYDWLDNYENAFFTVNVNVDVVSSYLIS